MNEARTARENALTFEAKKDGLSQRQDGSLVVRFKLHPNDEVDALVKAPMGTRYTMALVELNDDDTPKVQARTVTQEPAARTKKSPAQMAGILCADPKFRRYIAELCNINADYMTEEKCAQTVRVMCNVHSRSEITDNPIADANWRKIVSNFRAWEAAPRAGA